VKGFGMLSFVEFGRSASGEFFWGPPREGSSGAEGAEELDHVITSADVVFFDLPSCPFCRRAEAALRSEGIDFRMVHISEYRGELKQRTGKTSAPSVWIKGTYVGGCNDGTEPWHGVLPMLASGKFQDMLKH